MKLGDVVQVSVGVPDLEESKSFYEKLGFRRIAENQRPWPWAQYSDGQHLLLLNQDGNEYVGLTYFSADAGERAQRLEEQGVNFFEKREENGRLSLAIFADENGLMVGLIQHDPAEVHHPAGDPLSLCGKFGELAVGVKDFANTAVFWEKFGFKRRHYASDPYRWGILSDGLMVLGLHQTDDFKANGPAMTYYAPDMGQRIETMKARGIEPVEESKNDEGVVNGAILEAPGGQTFFLFEGQV